MVPIPGSTAGGTDRQILLLDGARVVSREPVDFEGQSIGFQLIRKKPLDGQSKPVLMFSLVNQKH